MSKKERSKGQNPLLPRQKSNKIQKRLKMRVVDEVKYFAYKISRGVKISQFSTIITILRMLR